MRVETSQRAYQALRLSRYHLGAALIVAVAAIFVVHLRTSQVDDSYITYRYAQSLARGQGFSYNPPEIVFGTTTPLYTLLLAGAGWLGLDIVAASLGLNILSAAGLALVAQQLVARLSSERLGWLAAAGVVLLPGTYLALGMETLTYSLFIYAGLSAAAQGRQRLAIVACALATLTRYDGALAAGVVLLAELLATRRLPWRSGMLYGALLLPWLAAATVMFGSPLPNTLAAKAGYTFGSNPFLAELGDNLALAFTCQTLTPAVGWALALAGVYATAGAARGLQSGLLRPMLAWLGLYLVAYTMLRLAYVHTWYYYPLVPGLLICAVVGVGAALGRLRGLAGGARRAATLALATSLALLGAVLMLGVALRWDGSTISTRYAARYEIYRAAAEWLCRETPADATVAIPEIGIIGWHCPRQIIDPYGLVTPQMIPYIQADDTLAGIAELRPDYILLQDVPRDEQNPPLSGAERLPDRYELVHSLRQEGFARQVVIYAKVEP